ncbi:hypothetical protein K491DRAFT_721551 [Lophiostoma macrostomum CBS 122681]|uniref:Uncharacterized protein n=1 Tax=Lophiostoma macrostomum CBS 122681 TaxID=1314788 RepID=A0A6A6SSL2_9PLEO|nr:hypothetical protein K491DRAFT_721551 [Lophiostoma macrostomum CBS 122681]
MEDVSPVGIMFHILYLVGLRGMIGLTVGLIVGFRAGRSESKRIEERLSEWKKNIGRKKQEDKRVHTSQEHPLPFGRFYGIIGLTWGFMLMYVADRIGRKKQEDESVHTRQEGGIAPDEKIGDRAPVRKSREFGFNCRR